MYPWIFFLLLHAEWPSGAHFGVSKILSMVWLKPRNDMRERKGEAMRVRKEPTQKRRGGGIRFKSIISAGVKRALKVGAALIASVAMLTAGTAFAVDEPDRIADGDTRNMYTESFGTTNSTRYAGRIWTDKSVSADGSVMFDDGDGGANPITINKDESDFLVTYSAMATSQIITGQAPTDTVFILDLSASMTWGYSDPQEAASVEKSRLYAMVNAVNSAIDELVKSNPQNRIAIVAFSGNLPKTQTQLLPALTTGEELLQTVHDGKYLSLTDWKPGEDNDHDDTSAKVVCNHNGHTVGTAGGTNIQAGLFAGMKILADNLDTTYEVNGTTVTRIPNVVLMSDGAPTTFSSAANAEYQEYENSDEDGVTQCTGNYRPGYIYGKISDRGIRSTPVCRNRDTPVYSGSWWKTNSGLQIGAGDNDNPDSADGVMALLTAAYFKDRITARYYGNDNGENQANVYTVGFATNVQNSEMAMMANIVLNPAEYLDDAASFSGADNEEADAATRETNNEQIRQVPRAIAQYLSGQDQDAVMQGSIGDGGNEDQIKFVVRSKEDHPEQDLISVHYPTQAFSADDDESLNNALSQIVGLITEHAKAPTQVNPGENPAQSGYITYVDPIGEYMHVDSVKSLIWAGKQFVADNSQTANGTTTYTFHAADGNGNDYIDSPVYGQHSVNDIIVTTYDVQAADGVPAHQELKVQIPANSISLRVNTVTLDGNGNPTSNKSNNALPLRLVYGVSLNGNVRIDDGRVNSNVVPGKYVNNHHDSSGNVLFYTNLYSGTKDPNDNGLTLGDATVTFTPATDNPFYYVQEDTPLYTCTVDESGQVTGGEPQLATGLLKPDQRYCFKITYYEDGKDGTPIKQLDWVNRLGSEFDNNSVGYDAEDRPYLKAGSPRLGNLQDISKDKVASEGSANSNPTGTATRRLRPTWDATNSQFVVHLGNNGRMTVTPPVEPGEASVTVQKTFAGRGWDENDVFQFTLKPTGDNANSAPLPDFQNDAVNVDSEGHTATVTVGKPANGESNSVTLGFTFPVTSLVNGKKTVYTYEIQEVKGSLPAVSYDSHTATVTITVSPDSNDEDNKLDTSVSVNNTGAPNETDRSNKTAAAFTNTFVSVSALPLTGGGASARGFVVAGGGVLLMAGVVWLLARRRRV